MRKRLVALLSLAGLANSATPATLQVSKGSSPPADTKSESQVKIDKTQQENVAAQNDASKKIRKAGGEQQAAKDVVTEKIGPDHVVHKHIGGVKYEKSSAETNAGKTENTVKLRQGTSDAASKDAAKMTKAKIESTSIQNSQIKKDKTISGESTAVQSEAGKKHRKAQQDAITIKQKTTDGPSPSLQKQTDKASPK
ncbi:MAG TPA: hypothetical protein VKL40_12395 [Candidatus Angelobacter sp.]|nr:hypothetical protein [Candidatus Angelobacter sp.]